MGVEKARLLELIAINVEEFVNHHSKEKRKITKMDQIQTILNNANREGIYHFRDGDMRNISGTIESLDYGRAPNLERSANFSFANYLKMSSSKNIVERTEYFGIDVFSK